MLIEDYQKLYERKTGEKSFAEPGFRRLFVPSRGFLDIRIQNKDLAIISSVCGECKFWLDFLTALSSVFGYKACITETKRNIKVFIRALGFKIEQIDIRVNERPRYSGKDKYGRKFQATPRGNTYIFEWEVR